MDWFAYREPLGPYRQLAVRMRDILGLMRLLKEGEQPNEENLSDNSILQAVPNMSLRSWYGYLWRQVNSYWKIADIKMTLAGFEATNEGLSLATPPGVLVQFGGWIGGHSWDCEQASLTRAGNTIVAPSMRMEYLLAEGMYPDDAKECREALFRQGYRESSSGECTAPYSEYSRSLYRSFGLGESRPSALLNVLEFQLLRKVLLPEETYFCHFKKCGRPYQYDEEQALNSGMLPKGKDSKEWGNSKPHKGRPVSFCSHFCRNQHDLEERRQRYQARKADEPSHTNDSAPLLAKD